MKEPIPDRISGVTADEQVVAPQDVALEHSIERAREVGAPLEAGGLGSVGDGRPHRLLVIGLDGAVPELVLGAWRDELQMFDMLATRGVWGRLRSSIPHTRVPAWVSLLSGHDPGQTGVYGRRCRLNHSYASSVPIDSYTVRVPRLWNLVGDAGKRVAVVGAPATTPVSPVQGPLIGDMLEQGHFATYPASLGQQVMAWLDDAPLSRPVAKDNPFEYLISDIYTRTEQRFWLARRLLARDVYDCFVLIDDGMDAMQRALWESLDTAHPRYQPNHPFAGAIGSFYRFVDDQIGELLELVDDDTIVALVSACGAQSLDGELALNEWLIATGELVLHRMPDMPTPIAQCDVDWQRTRVWADEDGAIYLNIAGREPQGGIQADQVGYVSASIAGRLRAIAGPVGESGVVDVYRTSTLYSTPQGVVPDLIAVCSLPGWRTTSHIGYGRIWLDTHTARLEGACETSTGFMIVYDPHSRDGGREIHGATIYDVVPSLLTRLGQPVPARLQGRDRVGG